jgi:SAM-dependent methyltransferase
MQAAMRNQRTTWRVQPLTFALHLSLLNVGYAAQAHRILERIDVPRGICVILGDSTGNLTSRLAGNTELSVYAQLRSPKQVTRLRQRMDTAGLLGRRVWIERGDLSRIHLADNVADVLVAVNNATGITRAEALRVLRPKGKALLGDQELGKPFPTGIDDWSHPYHGPDNNPQSLDQVGRAPYLTQFPAEPYYAPLIQVERWRGRLRSGLTNIEAHERPLATVVELRNEAWMHTILIENPWRLWRNGR